VDGGATAESERVLESAGNGDVQARFEVAVSRSGYYEVAVRWPKPSVEPAAVSVEVHHRFGIAPYTVLDQGKSFGQWNPVGVFLFDVAGANAVVLKKVEGSTLIVDAIRLQWMGEVAPPLEPAEATLPVGEVDDAYAGQLNAQAVSHPMRGGWRAACFRPG